ncbi:Metallo-hydrolase/oxidoreductase [Armillaria novae-zelandiae]|uniref:Metallo-hydrolase/oxidoreductase n=1 Tax=Armillaria novae-zelandiae TaxID=153914 RepID=A0AA39P5P2_9AGAR|nr:Metallo-hydrolase/oxidoreductase [Armillaria novae-zelandiae]
MSASTIRVVDEPAEERKLEDEREGGWAGYARGPHPQSTLRLPKVGVPVRTPTWGTEEEHQGEVKATWLGHACFLVEFPFVASLGRGARILFDPVFSQRCAPTQFFGPKRYTEMPCKIEDIPEVDAVVISHNHYDHLDTHTIRTLFKRARSPHIFAPLGNESYFASLGIPKDHAHTLDWWDARRVEHWTGRGAFDQGKTLWASWAVEGEGKKVYFAGDTGYRSVKDGEDEDERPVCPAFKEIGDKFGGFDPCDDSHWGVQAEMDSVRIFKDVRAKKAVAIHWGTWVLTTEEIMEPPKRLAE